MKVIPPTFWIAKDTLLMINNLLYNQFNSVERNTICKRVNIIVPVFKAG
jgi:hypothetical protein